MPERNDVVQPRSDLAPSRQGASSHHVLSCWLSALGLLAFSFVGCRSFQADPIVERVPDSEVLWKASVDGQLTPAMMVAFERQLVDSRKVKGRTEEIDRWIESKAPGSYRWRNQGLDEIDGQYLPALIKSKSRLAAAAAVIGVSRQSGEATAELVDVVRDATLSIATGRAAVETLAATASAETFDGVFDELSDPEKEAFSKPVYAELIVSLALQDAEPQDPRWLQALAGDRDIKLAVLRGWEQLAREPLPDAGRPLLTYPENTVRAAALRAFAACEGERHLSEVLAAARKQNLVVQIGAIHALGFINATSSRDELRRLLLESSTEIRAAALRALARLRDFEAVDQVAASDRSWRVRLAAADTLYAREDVEGADVAMQLVTDENPQVQAAAIRAIQRWDVRLCGPIYFHALDSRSIMARKLAAKQLSDHWPTALLFDPSVSAAQRRGQLKMLRRVWPYGGLGRRELNEVDAKQLSDWSDAIQSGGENRQQAADSIAKMANRVYFDNRSIARLTAMLSKETNRSIRRPLARAIASRHNQSFHATLTSLLEDPDSELNIIGLRYIERYGDLRDASLCRSFLTHADSGVRHAAVVAISEIGDSQAESAITQRLGDSQFETRIAAAVTLCGWGADSGILALERFAASEDPNERRRAAAAMADVGQQLFTPHLLRLIDDPDDSVSQTASRSLMSITGAQGPAITADMNPIETRSAWKAWSARR